MPFVIDASVTAAWALLDEIVPQAKIAENHLEHDFALVPHIWWYEIRNLLVVNERRNRISSEESASFLRILSAYPIRIDSTEDAESIFLLARQHKLSFYDAAYLSLAVRNRVPLATLDKDLRSAAVAAGIQLLT